MLRSPQLRSKVPQPFVCWNCLSRYKSLPHKNTVQSTGSESRWYTSPRLRNSRPRTRQISKRGFQTSSALSATIETSPIESFATQDPHIGSLPSKGDIRQRLRQWEAHSSFFIAPRELEEDSKPGDARNAVTRPGGDFTADPDLDETYEDVHIRAFDRDDLLDLGNSRVFLRPGDLVELLGLGGAQRELAIFTREFATQSQFYTMSGRWLHRRSTVARFYVPHFVQPEELDELRPYLPSSDVPETMRDTLHSLPQLVPRNVGKPIIRKMLEFWAQSDEAYQAASFRLDNAHKLVAHPERYKYATLDEIASTLLTRTIPKSADGNFPFPMLYAVHRSLLIDDLGFRPQVKGTLRAGGQYEISSAFDASIAETTQKHVHQYITDQVARSAGAKPSRISHLECFAIKARRLVDLSRMSRQFTEHGTIGPSSLKSKDMKHFRSGEEGEKLDSIDQTFIRFLEAWAALGMYGKQSPLNGIGSTILRATKRYEKVDLNQNTAWTFLQEIGALAPWESRWAFEMRLPNVGRRLLTKHADERNTDAQSYVADKLKDLRHDWGDLPVYCIDDPSADDIDDGVSVEATNSDGEYWVHVHTADPASHLNPEGPVAKHAEIVNQSVYMPERVVPMLSADFTRGKSLAPNRPCLTFSARINTDGYLLDYKITPGIVRHVEYLSPEVFRRIVSKSAPITETTTRIVGSSTMHPSPSPSRPMLRIEEITDLHEETLSLLQKLGEALENQRKAKGKISGWRAFPSVSVSFNDDLVFKPNPGFSLHFNGDPTIQLSTENIDSEADDIPRIPFNNTVESLMLIAGEVGARWCHDRGIPIVYRVTPRNPDKVNPADFFAQKVLPTMDEHGYPAQEQEVGYIQLLGTIQPSSIPGPHAPLGVDMFARCTSPLRRFPDLLLHWQVEAALLEEARLGKTLIGNKEDDFLPFTRAQVDALLPRIDTRERIVAWGQRQSVRHWLCHFLLRAWRFKEAEIPSKFPFFVKSIDLEAGHITGIMAPFITTALCPISSLPDQEEVKPGDKLEVELSNVNTYSLKIEVKALRRLTSNSDT